MIESLFRVRAYRAGIPTRQQAFFMRVVAGIARDTAVLVQRDGSGRSLGGTRDFQELPKGQTHLGFHLIGRHILRHIGRRGGGHVRGNRVALCHDMAIPAQRGGFGPEAVRGPFARLRVHRRDTRVAPQTRIRLKLVGLELIVGVEGAVILGGMTSETEQQRIGVPTATQKSLAGRRRRLPDPAVLRHIVATEAGQCPPRKREIAGNPPRECWTWFDVDHVSLTSGLPPIMTRLA
jgi:hypothetical protein